MKCVILSIGKEKDGVVDDAIAHFMTRLLRYVPLEWVYLPHDVTKEKEGVAIMGKLKKEDYVVLLDERGHELTSPGLSELIENRMVDGAKRMVFVIGGAYGVSDEVTKRANYVWKLSNLVFPHMIARLIILEQIYRAMTILQGEKYHHA